MGNLKKKVSEKILNNKSITLITIFTYIVAMITFEIGYCNTQILKYAIYGVGEIYYNFSISRIVVYIVFIALFILFKNKFIEKALESSKNKYKRIFIYSSLIAAVFAICFTIIIYFVNIDFIRAVSIGLIAALMGEIFILYVSNDLIMNTIIIGCTFGIVFSFATSFNHAIDEKKHFITALNVSILNFDYDNDPLTYKQIENLPQLSKYTVKEVDEALTHGYKNEDIMNVNKEDVPSSPASYSPLVYAVSALGIATSRLLGGSILDMYMMGRIFNLAFYIFLLCIVLKILPYKKNIFFTLAMLPYMLLLATSYSIDGACIGFVFIFVAYCLKLYEKNDSISLKQFFILAVLFVLMLFAKSMAYILVGLVALILPIKNTLKKNKKYLPIIITMIVTSIVILTGLCIYMKNSKIAADTRAQGTTNVSEQLQILLTKPIHDIKLLISHVNNTLLNFTWLEDLHPPTFFTALYSGIAMLLIFFIVYVAISEDDKQFKIKDKIVMVISFLGVFLMTSLLLYLSYTQVGALYIAGYQTRYIVPILPLVLILISNKKLKTQNNENRNMNIAILSGIFIFIGILQLIVV